jgi:hypothetical protein
MAWAFVETVPEGSIEAYDKVVAELGDIGTPDGLILHLAGMSEKGMRVIDVWESKAHHDRFRSQTLLPAMERALGHPPDADVLFEPMDVHHLFPSAEH